MGATVSEGGVNFALFSAHADRVTLCLFSPDGRIEQAQIDLPARTGDIWHGFITGLKTNQLYGYRVHGPYDPEAGHRFNPNKLLIDPYARELSGDVREHEALYGYDPTSPLKDLSFNTIDSAPYMPKSVVTGPTPTREWRRPRHSWNDTVIYEAHVKGLTKRHPKISKTDQGRFSALADPAITGHLKTIGMTAIELLPVQYFHAEPRLTLSGLTNYWGYNPINFFVPHPAYGRVSEFQNAAKALHESDIEVLLDVVYNHTAESDELGPTLSFRGIDNASYYHLQADKRFYRNETGTGNALNMNHAAVLNLAMDSLRYWAETMGVDGFRFDLATTLARNPDHFDPNAAFFDRLKNDPVLSACKLIAEPWDIGEHGYCLGQYPADWREWNDRFRDDTRSYWRGGDNVHKKLAGRLLGSADEFDHNGRAATSSINLVTAHDGFTLHDVVSFNHKHNLANGEDNRDGHNHNLSDNMGHEGATDNTDITAARRNRKKNMLATLLLSQGTPMLLAGDELGQSQNGNNNGYCQDNDTTWIDWENRDTDLEQFVSELTSLRCRFPQIGQSGFLHGERIDDQSPAKNVIWVTPEGTERNAQDWDDPGQDYLALVLNDRDGGALLVIMNRGAAREFPVLADGDWRLELGTIHPDQNSIIPAHSVCVFSRSTSFVSLADQRAYILARADAYGFVQQFRDINGTVHQADINTVQDLLGRIDHIPPIGAEQDDKKPHQIPGVQKLRDRPRQWGVTCALYGLHSDRSWGIGDFADLARLCEILAANGADFAGINPVHDLFPAAPHLYAPYSPSSREFLNVMHIAPDQIPEFDGRRPMVFDGLRSQDPIDYSRVYRAKHAAFKKAYSNFKNLSASHPRQKAFESFKKARGDALQKHALYCVLFERLTQKDRNYSGWMNFPKKYHDPDSKACHQLAKTESDRVNFYAWLQWIAFTQLQHAQTRATRAGMKIGLYLDIAVGVVPGGSDVWRNQSAFAEKVSLGAPGDMANPDGQMWNLTPLNPTALAVTDFLPFRRVLEATMSVSGAVRIDHVLGLYRSYWISETTGKGAYLQYPWERLTTIIAELAALYDCIVIGEDLGTIPDELRERMAKQDMIGCDIYIAHRDAEGQLEMREDMRALALTSYTNHDFPTLSGFWESGDLELRTQLGIGDHPDLMTEAYERRHRDKSRLAALSGLECCPDKLDAQSMADLQAYLAAGPSLLFAVTLGDLMLDNRQPNVPGTTTEHPNWQIPARLRLEAFAEDKTAHRIMASIHTARGNG